jgi:ribonuclease-3
MNRTEAFNKIQTSLGYRFKNIKHLEEALTHDSHRVNDRTVPTYQRLEFLGDSVLDLVISDHLYREHPEFDEGQLSKETEKLTKGLQQGKIAEKFRIKDYVSFGQSVNKENFLGYHNFVESLIGAVYIDGGLDEAKKVIHRLWELNGNSTPAAAAGCVIS